MNGQALRAITADRTVGEVTHDHPDTLAVMQRMGINHCCGAQLTLTEAAASAGTSIDDLLASLRQAVGEIEGTISRTSALLEGRGPSLPRPAPLVELPECRRVHIDVREDLRCKREPFSKIMALVETLGPDQVLVLRAPFEPIPLYDVLGERGLAHWTERRAVQDWCIWFYRRADEPGGADPRERVGALSGSGRQVLDVRGLEPPGPMVRVLEAVERLGPGEEIEVLHERRPVFLYPQLEGRGFTHETDEPQPGVVRIVIRRSVTTR